MVVENICFYCVYEGMYDDMSEQTSLKNQGGIDHSVMEKLTAEMANAAFNYRHICMSVYQYSTWSRKLKAKHIAVFVSGSVRCSQCSRGMSVRPADVRGGYRGIQTQQTLGKLLCTT